MAILTHLSSVALIMSIAGGLTACSDPVHEFSENDFKNATRFFCQKPNYAGSPLQANSYVLYYDSESKMANVGQFVYMGDYEWSDTVGEANLYATDIAMLTDNSVMLHLDHIKEDKTLHILIDRKTLNASFDYKAMTCKKVDKQEIKNIKVQLASEHIEYKEANMRENKI
ncbi:hypothetical protein [Alteromonas gracilis]|uniref:hypothetical protein n=1 Tax=Alteromonas gracilis TaxID=1479524 RepID=UPI003736C0E0